MRVRWDERFRYHLVLFFSLVILSEAFRTFGVFLSLWMPKDATACEKFFLIGAFFPGIFRYHYLYCINIILIPPFRAFDFVVITLSIYVRKI